MMDSAPEVRALSVPLKCALVVDADAQLTRVLSDTLKPNEWVIVNTTDNESALTLLTAKPFDLVVTGAKTSGKEDVELLRRIRRVRPHVRLIILTDDGTPADVVSAMREGAFSYFSKPFSESSLGEIIRIAIVEPAWDDGIEVVSATAEWISILARCDKGTGDRLVRFFEEMTDLPEPERADVATAFREMLLNALEHGGAFDPTQYVEISYVRTRKVVMCRIKDPGEGFALEELYHAAISNPVYDPIRHTHFRAEQGLRPGGYGILMTEHLVDELVYSERGNEVLLVKYLLRAQLPG